MKIVKRFITPDGKEFVAFRASNGNIVIALDPHAYQDIVGMPATIDVSFGTQVYNYTAATLYFTIEGSGGGAPWSWGSAQELGSITTGLSKLFHVPSLGSRSKPASAVDDGIVLTFRAYSDAGYTEEVGSGYPIVVTYHWIDSDAMTLLDLDDFDADSTEDWTASVWSYITPSGTYVLSAPRSAKTSDDIVGGTVDVIGYISKTFTVPAATTAYLIANVKYEGWMSTGQTSEAKIWVTEMRISKAGAIIVRTGTTSPYIMSQPYNIYDKQTNWFRIIAPIDVGEAAEYRLETAYYLCANAGKVTRLNAYYDNLKVVYEE